MDDISEKEEVGEQSLSFANERGRLLLYAALSGLLAGLVVSVFGITLDQVDALREELIVWARSLSPFGWFIPITFTILTAGISIFLIKTIAPQAGGGGIPYLKALLQDERLMDRPIDWKKVLPVKFTACVCALGSGLLLGRVGPAVLLGAAGGEALGQRFKVSQQNRRILLTASAGAGLAAIYNVPLAGLAFSLEVLRGSLSPIALLCAAIAAGLADLVTRLIRGGSASFTMPTYHPTALNSLPLFALLGIAIGLLGFIYKHSLLVSLKLLSRLPEKHIWLRAASVAALVGLAGWVNLDWVGSGHRLAEHALAGSLALSVIPLVLFIRLALTGFSFGSGAPGGVVAPLLSMGALAGLLFGRSVNMLFPLQDWQPGIFAVVGMAALFSAVIRAPVTAILLIVEMTGDFYLILPLAVASLVAEGVMRLLKSRAIFSHLVTLLSDEFRRKSV
jgi:CIC family chloride channel protein